MTTLALILVLLAAFLHATWNYLLKRAGGGASYLWLMSACSAVIYCPLALLIYFDELLNLGLTEWAFIAGSAAIHVAYFAMLQKGYRVGDLSLIYPLARGTGPTLSTLMAIVILAERPTLGAMIGAGLVVCGVVLLSRGGGPVSRKNIRSSVLFGVITGCFIATYTLWDKYIVAVLMVPPLVLDAGSFIGRLAILAPHASRNVEEMRSIWRNHRLEVLGVAILSPLAYILVLTAMTFTPVSYVAPLRESSVLFAVLLGWLLLKEGSLKPRLLAAGLIVLGVVLMALN